MLEERHVPEDHQVTAEGVWFESKDRAKLYADASDKDLVEADGGWLAKNRSTQFGRMQTKDGDVVIFHLQQKFRVWVATWDGAQGPDPNVEPLTVWNADEARNAAREWASEESRIFLLEKDGQWTLMAD
jgi:hypothetical protein